MLISIYKRRLNMSLWQKIKSLFEEVDAREDVVYDGVKCKKDGFLHEILQVPQNWNKLKEEHLKQIESFILLNEFDSVDFITDTDILHNAKKKYSNRPDPQLLVITDLKFSRYPCKIIIEKIKEYSKIYSALYICLNKCYINIDNSFHDISLDSNYNLAITQWLKKFLKDYNIIDLSLDTIEDGQSFTWVIPDRHFLITKQ